MSYNKKIQLMEQIISELNEELKIVTSRLEENIENIGHVLDSTDDDVIPLKEATVKKDHNKRKSSSNVLKEKLKISISMSKKAAHLELERLRLRSRIIGKISPTTSEFLDSKINEFEKSAFKLIKLWENFEGETEKKDKERKKLAKYLADRRCFIEDLIVVSQNCIKDTLDKIKS